MQTPRAVLLLLLLRHVGCRWHPAHCNDTHYCYRQEWHCHCCWPPRYEHCWRCFCCVTTALASTGAPPYPSRFSIVTVPPLYSGEHQQVPHGDRVGLRVCGRSFLHSSRLVLSFSASVLQSDISCVSCWTLFLRACRCVDVTRGASAEHPAVTPEKHSSAVLFVEAANSHHDRSARRRKNPFALRVPDS